ncbi:MAG: NADP-dependent phosphogluconate dehydrogenase [Myxococcota bacterium]
MTADTKTTASANFGVLGLGVMGRNLALNVADHGFSVAVYNRSTTVTEQFLACHPDAKLVGTRSTEEFIAALEPPRRILLMIKAGDPVDKVLDGLKDHLSEGDIVIDGGNSWFEDTVRREKMAREAGFHFVGMGVSGGEEGARFGPSLMPGGTADAWKRLKPVLEAIAADSDSGPCVTHCGPDGAGHFVKMVHYGIEYGDMQLIAESYDIMRRGMGLSAGRIADIFDTWNRDRLESFLVELTAKVLRVTEKASGEPLVDFVQDKAGQKGTGRWTVRIAIDMGVAIPTITAAVDARVLSSMKDVRVAAEKKLRGPASSAIENNADMINAVGDALYAAKICSYAQGMILIATASSLYGWGIDLRETARIWKAGCIIRARLLDTIMNAYERRKDLPSLLLDEALGGEVEKAQGAWRRVVGAAQNAGIPVPAMSASLAYFDSYRTGRLPQNLTQAHRDAFGAHTYERTDRLDEGFVHTDWLGGD